MQGACAISQVNVQELAQPAGMRSGDCCAIPDCAVTTPRDQDSAFGTAEKCRAGHKGSVTQAVALDVVCTLHADRPHQKV